MRSSVFLKFRFSVIVATVSLAPAFATFSPALNVAIQRRDTGKPRIETVIWQDPGAVEKLDFVLGAGSQKKLPTPPYTFIEESFGGSNPKIKVRDANDILWHVKWGSEVNAEVFASRIGWAAGYFVDPAYFVPDGKIEAVRDLKRAKKYVRPDGSFTDARFERHRNKGATVLENEKGWRWDQNPLVGTPELNGLKIVMMLTSNWDNKDVRDISRGSNTAILEYHDDGRTERRYMVTDWGGSMGKWGGVMGREKWDAKGYERQTPDFIKGVAHGFVEFGYSGQHTGTFKEGITVNDVKWLLRYVGRITDKQIRDGLKASGANSDEVERFTRAIRDRIEQMRKL